MTEFQWTQYLITGAGTGAGGVGVILAWLSRHRIIALFKTGGGTNEKCPYHDDLAHDIKEVKTDVKILTANHSDLKACISYIKGKVSNL